MTKEAYAYVESQFDRCDGILNGGPAWNGWALREAFIAGRASTGRQPGLWPICKVCGAGGNCVHRDLGAGRQPEAPAGTREALKGIYFIATSDSRGWSHWDRVALICERALASTEAPAETTSVVDSAVLSGNSLGPAGLPSTGASWISVEEQVPGPDGVEVLVYVPGGKYSKVDLDEWTIYREDPLGMGGATIETGEGWGNHEFEEVTHWMRLPEAPAERGTEGPRLQPQSAAESLGLATGAQPLQEKT